VLHRLRAALSSAALETRASELRTRTVLSRGHLYGTAEDTDDAFTPGLPVSLRPIRASDGSQWRAARIEDQHLLQPFEPTTAVGWDDAHSPEAWRKNFHNLQVLAADRLIVPMVIDVDGEFAGQLTIGNIQYGTISSAWIGYWVHSRFQGRGVATAAVALGVDLGMQEVGLHRIEATVMAENVASRRVLEKTGFRTEGHLRRNLHINGQWRDHYLVAQTQEEVLPEGLVRRLVNRGLLGLAVNRQ